MTASTKIGRLDLRLCDCMDVLRSAPDGCFDLAIVDPPYGIGNDGGNTGKHWRFYPRKGWDSSRPAPEYFKELRRVSRHQIIWGGNYMTEHIPPSMGWVFWDKGQNLTMSDGELAYTSFNRALRRVVINRCKIGEHGGNIHPTQKPVSLYAWLLENYAEPGWRVLDTHMGSGSLAIACHNSGHELVACEIDPDYYWAAVERIRAATNQGLLCA